ncbi:MAG TPA: hypothetical protein VGO47_03320, partial [Chlamydiales bacterium]|nr:hypothetical protein [Chlamydiales bacterium]
RQAHGLPIYPKDWIRKMPYDFTGCLAHVDLTYNTHTFVILRITGILDHNAQCQEQVMQRLPAIPLHVHVWEVALQQLANGTRLAFFLYFYSNTYIHDFFMILALQIFK